MVVTTFEKQLTENGLDSSAPLPELAKPPFHTTSTTRFANYFEAKAEVDTLLCQRVDAFKSVGGIIADLKQA